jgi:hypothetical protein
VKSLKGRYYTIEIDHCIRAFEWNEYMSLRDIQVDLSFLLESGLTSYDYKVILF